VSAPVRRSTSSACRSTPAPSPTGTATKWVRLGIESNPLPICTRPQVLRSARRT
jgi:hypothetical protein